MKRTWITIALTTVVVLVLMGILSSVLSPRTANTFSTISQSLDGGYGGGASPEIMMEAPRVAPAPGEFYAADSSAAYNLAYEESALAATERLVIQNADLSIVVTDPKARMEEIAQMAKDMGGFVVNSNIYQTTYGPNNLEVPQVGMTIRIPSERLDEALETIKEGAVDVNYENRSGEDVTSQYVDLESRLSAKRAAEKKLLEIMETTEAPADTLAVYGQLQQIQTEIEVLVGQMKYYEESAALSAVSITLVAEETVQPIEIGGWKLQGTANDAVQDLILFTQGFVQFLIRFFLSFLPALILIAIPLYGAYIGGRALYRRFNRSNVTVETKEEEKK